MSFDFCNFHSNVPFSGGAKDNFYKRNFVPGGWKLFYFGPLAGGVSLYLTGHCKSCYQSMEEMISLPKQDSEEEMFRTIYDTMQTAHPYSSAFIRARGEAPDYYSDCKERDRFYHWRDKMPQYRRNTEFLRLFHDYDRERARLWLEKNYPLPAHDEVLRDTGGSLFCTALRMAKESGDFDKAAAILDYVLPCEHETGAEEGKELTAYEFDFVPVVNFGGSEGIYLDCSLRGKFDESGRFTLPVGTIKTLRTDLEAAKIMAELGGALMYHADRYVNQELHRYTPEEALRKEAQRKKEAESC